MFANLYMKTVVWEIFACGLCVTDIIVGGCQGVTMWFLGHLMVCRCVSGPSFIVHLFFFFQVHFFFFFMIFVHLFLNVFMVQQLTTVSDILHPVWSGSWTSNSYEAVLCRDAPIE